MLLKRRIRNYVIADDVQYRFRAGKTTTSTDTIHIVQQVRKKMIDCLETTVLK